ncbi:MAG TPA: four helix bundle protein [Prolixibacteraceae bacterium]|nr:four helix bundle protein [Prolixibacteraceae bacterium]
MSTITCFEDLEIWQLSREMCAVVYHLTKKVPFSKDFELIDQVRRSSGSVMDNIAEGFEREGNKEFIQFLSIAKGSSGECRSQIYRAKDREYISDEEFEDIKSKLLTISVKIKRFMDYLKATELKGNKYKR